MEGESRVLLGESSETMEGESRVLLGESAGTEHGAPPTGGGSARRLAAASLLAALCLVAAAVLIAERHAKGRRRDEDGFGLHHTLRQIANVRAAIHLQGAYNPDMKTSVEWRSRVDQSHSQGRLELDNNEIVVPQSGLYFVYSQASFRVGCSGGADDITAQPAVHLSHIVKRWSSTYGSDDAKRCYQTILHAVHTACQKTASGAPAQGGGRFATVYTGAVFSLHQGDRLKTAMEEETLAALEDEPGKTFFGAFAL
ncbi:tumor necrosis factor-like [Brachionichthys hirsutus]|uniref:tumor necrosis factor-like n=1 Tax=Brachionichthys hirsutus TaxID=412623 RepID=UPI0036053425